MRIFNKKDVNRIIEDVEKATQNSKKAYKAAIEGANKTEIGNIEKHYAAGNENLEKIHHITENIDDSTRNIYWYDTSQNKELDNIHSITLNAPKNPFENLNKATKEGVSYILFDSITKKPYKVIYHKLEKDQMITIGLRLDTKLDQLIPVEEKFAKGEQGDILGVYLNNITKKCLEKESKTKKNPNHYKNKA